MSHAPRDAHRRLEAAPAARPALQGALPPLPERDTIKPVEHQGLFRKFIVTRTDGSSEPGGKHEHCEYFVLDVDHDPHAAAALAAYAAAVEATHPELAADMRARYALAAAQVPQSERAWLVEWRFNGVQWLYLWPSAPGGFSFTADPNSALRFARREDAEACLAWAREVDRRRGAVVAGGDLLVTEHEWPNVVLREAVPLTDEQIDGLRGLDTASRVRFYEHDFYVLSNFSAFTLVWKGIRFDTSEAAYHYEKFTGESGSAQLARHFIQTAPSAHEAFKVAEWNKEHRRPDWDDVKVGIMLDILRAKAMQHEYVRRKLLATGDRELVEDSWRDDFWGWGPNRDGKNMLGKLWMQVRSELRGITEQENPHG